MAPIDALRRNKIEPLRCGITAMRTVAPAMFYHFASAALHPARSGGGGGGIDRGSPGG